MQNVKVYYHENSIDTKFVAIINNLLFKDILISVNSNETNIHNFVPENIILNDDILYFVGIKPSKTWITNNQNQNKIIIFYNGELNSTYILNQSNVEIVQLLEKSICYNYFNYMLYNTQILNEYIVAYGIENTSEYHLQIKKIKSLLFMYEKYISTHKSFIIDYKALSAYQVILSLTEQYDSTNIININNFILSVNTLFSSNIGLMSNNFLKNKINKLFSKSNICETQYHIQNTLTTIKSLRINLTTFDEIKLIDQYLTNYVLQNNILIDFIEYFIIDSENKINLHIKKFNMFISPVEINNELLLLQHIGIDNKQNIIFYLTKKYNMFENNNNLFENNIVFKNDGMIFLKTTITKFFN